MGRTKTHKQLFDPTQSQDNPATIVGAKQTTPIFCTKYFKNPSGHGRLRRKSSTSAPKSNGAGDGEKFMMPGHLGVRVRNVYGKSGPKFMFMLFFPELMFSVFCFSPRFAVAWWDPGTNTLTRDKPPNWASQWPSYKVRSIGTSHYCKTKEHMELHDWGRWGHLERPKWKQERVWGHCAGLPGSLL